MHGCRRSLAPCRCATARSGTIQAHVGALGWVDFNWQTLELPNQRGYFVTTMFGAAGSRAAAAIAYLAASTTTAHRTQFANVGSMSRDIAS